MGAEQPAPNYAEGPVPGSPGAPNLRPGRVASRRSLDRQRITEIGWFADLPARPASPRRDKHSTDETGGAPSAALSISVFCVLGRPNVTALWRVLLLPWMGQWILASIRSCGQAPRLSRKRACHDDASVQQGRSITRAHVRARTPNISARDHGTKYARQCPS